MKKKLIILLSLTITSIFLGVKLNLIADQISDPNDIFQVNSPTANQRVSGTTNIVWRMYDNDQQVIPYSARIWDSDTCKTTNYGNINPNNNGVSSQAQDNVLQWNTKTTLNSTLSDGFYCLQICASFKQGTVPYSACNSRRVAIVNNNTSPIISSSPQNLTIHENDSWQYQIQASNPSGRSLKYYFTYGTDFLTINSQTGLIQTNSNSKALGSAIAKANYNIAIVADDGLYSPATQQFTLSIIKDSVLVQSSSTAQSSITVPASSSSLTTVSSVTASSSLSSFNTSVSSLSSNSSSSTQPYTIDFKTPNETSIFTGKTNKIEWVLSSFNNISLITINYSTDLIKWNKITSSADNINVYSQILGKSNYLWDVSNISDGVYYLQLVIKDKQGVSVNNISKQFQIKNKTDNNQSIPLIINVTPENNKNINDLTPEINGSFTPSLNQKIDPKSFKLLIDDKDYSSICAVTIDKFKCKLVDKLQEGKHKINVSIKDTTPQPATYESVFIILKNGNPLSYTSYPQSISGDTNLDYVNIFGFQLAKGTAVVLLLICCLLFLLLIIPWILYTLWSRNHKKVVISKSQTIEQHHNTPLETSNLSAYSPYQNITPDITSAPNVTTNYYKPYVPGADQATVTEPIAEFSPLASSTYSTGDSYPYPIDSTTTKTSTDPIPPVADIMPTDPNFDYNQAVVPVIPSYTQVVDTATNTTPSKSPTTNTQIDQSKETTTTTTDYTEPTSND